MDSCQARFASRRFFCFLILRTLVQTDPHVFRAPLPKRIKTIEHSEHLIRAAISINQPTSRPLTVFFCRTAAVGAGVAAVGAGASTVGAGASTDFTDRPASSICSPGISSSAAANEIALATVPTPSGI